jgi:hypothetical protein
LVLGAVADPDAQHTGAPVRVSWFTYDHQTPGNKLRVGLQDRHGSSASSLGSWATVFGIDAHGNPTHKSDPPLFSYDATLAPGSPSSARYYQFRLKAKDQAGNVATAKQKQPFRLTVYQDNDPAVSYTGSWTQYSSSTFPMVYGSTISASSSPGATAALTFHGTNVALISSTNSAAGTEKVCVDPGTTRESCSTVGPSSTAENRTILFARNDLDPSVTHQIKLTNQSGVAIIDAFEVVR